jgi:hypothetical protein
MFEIAVNMVMVTEFLMESELFCKEKLIASKCRDMTFLLWTLTEQNKYNFHAVCIFKVVSEMYDEH